VDNSAQPEPKKTPLYDLHVELGARMVPFAGYAMPVQYPSGILAEHLHTRAAAGLFDVSHMGQIRISGGDPAIALERLVPADIAGLGINRMRYTQFTNESGGILDDLMVTRRKDDLFLVVNASCKDDDFKHLVAGLPDCKVEMLAGRALLALQGPAAAQVVAHQAPDAAAMPFMSYSALTIGGIACLATRSGYTGEDGFELSVATADAVRLARLLLSDERVKPIGLGARDSLRLEAGLCLYGHDIDTTTTSVEAGLVWSIGKNRRSGSGYPGAAVIAKQIADGPARKRVGIRPDGRAPAREHTPITDASGATVGEITSGGFGPSVNGPVAMGYVPAVLAAADTPLTLTVRGKPLSARVARLPFVTKRYAG
jgi:aminomethyltransferase